ncbi:MAG: glycosyltransferase [Vagococcus sp.]|uniref:glycosyltransferase n=1 Tax=Vagococcus sp. TaxID=1933889 RepID=UPI002FC89764
MKKNVLHLLFSSEYGGAEKVVIEMIKSSSSIAKFIYVSKTGGIEDHLKEEKIDYYLLDKINLSSIHKLIHDKNINIIHAHDFKASIIASFFSKKCKVISHIHQSPIWFSKKNYKTILYKSRMNKISNVFVTSNDIKKSFPYQSFNKKFLVLENVVDTPILKESSQKKYDFLFVGRLEPEKRPTIFIDYINLLSNRFKIKNVAIVGKGSQLELLEKKVQTRKLNIQFLGFKKNPYDIMQKSKFLIVTSVKEGFGLAIIESMQLGVPVITMRIGGVTELLDETNSIIVEDFITIDDRIITLLNDEIEYKKMSRDAVIFGEKYRDKTKMINRLKEVYGDDC